MDRKTSNPALSNRIFENVGVASTGSDVMTIDGTVNKAFISIGITFATACWTFSDPVMQKFFIPSLIVSLVCAVILIFSQRLAPYLTPIYAAAEGCLLGTISLMYARVYEGIIFQAVTLTFAVFFCMLTAYKTGWIKATPAFKKTIMIATVSICFFYLGALIASLIGYPITFMRSSSPLSIGLSFVIVGIAALNLILDFDFIEQAANSRSMPKHMEWYGAFALLVTLIWLYLEILKLLAKLQRRD